MKKIRRGNDFVFSWAIERNGLPEDLSSVLEKHLYLSALGKRVELVEGVDYDITGNVVRIEVTPTIATILGAYKAEFHYILPDLGLIDEDRKCAVDVNAFVIVANTEQADNPSEFSITSDMAIAFKGDKGDKGDKGEKGDSFIYSDFTPEQLALLVGDKGDKGDPFTYDDFTPEQIEDLKRPAIEAAEVANQAAQEAIQAKEVTIAATENAITATENANEAADKANTAAGDANDAAEAANTAAGLANNAATTANTAAGLADTARLAIQDDLASKADQTELDQLAGEVKDSTEKAGAASLTELNARLIALEKIISSAITDRVEVTKEFNVWGKTNLILIGSGAATFAPDFVGQKYIDTAGGNVYVAVGVATAGNWKLV